MNILITGGFESNFTLGFAKGLAANGVDLCVVSCDETASRLTAAGIPNVNLRGSMDSGRSVWLKLVNLIRYYTRLLLFLLRHRGATIHFTGIFRNELVLWEGLILNLLFRLLAGRYLYTVHNVLPHSRAHSPLFRWVYRQIYQVPPVLLVHTHRARQQLMEEFNVSESRMVLTSIGLNEEMPLTALSRAEAASRLGLQATAKNILFFGKIDEYKGLDVLLEAFEQMPIPQSRLIIAGSFRNPAYRQRIMAQLEKMARRKDVHFFEQFIPNDEVEVYFKACDVLCLPYRHIYQSGVIFLGPRFGIPMVTTDVGALREFIGNHLGLVSHTNDAAGLAEALMAFLNAPERFSAAVILNRAQEYSWTAICQKLVSLYQVPADKWQPRQAKPHVEIG